MPIGPWSNRRRFPSREEIILADQLAAVTQQLTNARAELLAAQVEVEATKKRLDASDELLCESWAERNDAMAEVDRLRAENEAIRTLMNTYNLGGWTYAVEPMKRALRAEAEVERLRDKSGPLRVAIDAARKERS